MDVARDQSTLDNIALRLVVRLMQYMSLDDVLGLSWQAMFNVKFIGDSLGTICDRKGLTIGPIPLGLVTEVCRYRVDRVRSEGFRTFSSAFKEVLFTIGLRPLVKEDVWRALEISIADLA
ncbi:MAG TPA: hypothetical protein VFO29_01630 [Candidatus Rubrimentiphilum sp.]|nr:hypothetical protein [Candidatus Rubrimentiphilum sp.]